MGSVVLGVIFFVIWLAAASQNAQKKRADEMRKRMNMGVPQYQVKSDLPEQKPAVKHKDPLCQMGEVAPVNGSTEGESNYRPAQTASGRPISPNVSENYESMLAEETFLQQESWAKGIIMAEILGKPKSLR
ncbi:MAG: hypothetical protein KH354_07600 [Clostridiales bacterium]|nr:hypothetical protein [Clostridiales bacterium]